jgi:Holliday junction resolvase RusA-like endonuclease
VILTVQVPGLPVPQGSIRNLGRGRPSVHANADKLLPWRASRPDLDKLTRAAFDSLQESGAIRDDAQVVGLRAVKVYGTPGMALTVQAVVPAVTT